MRISLRASTLAVFLALAAGAQPDRITEPIDIRHRAQIAGHVRQIGGGYVDEGPLDASFPMYRLTLFLKPSALQQSALQRLLLDLQDPHSSNYHRWLTPEEYASRFGLSPSDAARRLPVSDNPDKAEIFPGMRYLASQGFVWVAR